MASTGPQELVDWVAAGHGFIGLHCATDTLHNFLPYIEMIVRFNRENIPLTSF